MCFVSLVWVKKGWSYIQPFFLEYENGKVENPQKESTMIESIIIALIPTLGMIIYHEYKERAKNQNNK
jgi:hypothetical protein